MVLPGVAMVTATLERGRELFRERAWGECYARLSASDRDAPLAGTDLELLATAAFLCGDDAGSDEAWARGFHFYVENDLPLQAARCAFWLAFGLMNRGEMARGGGWLGRARQLVGEHGPESVERGYLIVPEARRQVLSGEPAEGFAAACEAIAIADRYHDPDLGTLARLVAGHAEFLLGEPTQGFALLDEVMVGVTEGEVSPVITGLAYCSVIDACRHMFDIRRAREWTSALTRWCEEQPDLVPYRGLCLVHRTQIMQLDGSWNDAIAEGHLACERLAEQPAVGAAFYELGELHRLRGEFGLAEEMFRKANQSGHRPEPGLVLLRLGQGRLDAAEAGVRRLLGEPPAAALERAQILDAGVEVLLEAGCAADARPAMEELTSLAREIDVPLLQALAAQAKGAVLLAEGAAREALAALRQAWLRWRDLETPYHAARVRLRIGCALRALGDEDSAQMEFDSARWVFDRLGAAPDVARAEALAKGSRAGGSVLTSREIEVLRYVAAGLTNREIAAELVLSEKTVARHLSNIYAKLDISSRAAATAYVYDHGLL